jgi:hypothetical protein
MSPLDAAAEILAAKGYDFNKIGTLTNPHNADAYHVCVAGRVNQKHVIIVRVTPEGNYLFYLPIRGNDATKQVHDLAAWLAENSE